MTRSGAFSANFKKIPELWLPVPLEVCMNVSVKNPIKRSPVRLGFILIPLLLASFAVSPLAQADPQSRPSPTPSPAPGPQDVNVVNTPRVSDADNPAKQPFQASGSGEFIGSICDVTITTVPAGKRLIIEHVSVLGQMTTGQKMITAYIVPRLQGFNDQKHYLTISGQGTDDINGIDYYVASEQVRLYADPGPEVFGFAIRNTNSGISSFVHFVISGYLVDVP
jgi:hypothetical protein